VRDQLRKASETPFLCIKGRVVEGGDGLSCLGKLKASSDMQSAKAVEEEGVVKCVMKST